MAASETPAAGTTDVHVGPVSRFWQMSRGFLSGKASFYPWALIGLLVLSVVLDLALQYRLNLWNRDFFNSLDRRDASGAWAQAQMLFVLAASSVTLAIVAVWGRMTFQRLWRRWLTPQLLSFWLSKDRGRFHSDTRATEFAEYRIVEDARTATDAPIDFVVGLLTSRADGRDFHHRSLDRGRFHRPFAIAAWETQNPRLPGHWRLSSIRH